MTFSQSDYAHTITQYAPLSPYYYSNNNNNTCCSQRVFGKTLLMSFLFPIATLNGTSLFFLGTRENKTCPMAIVTGIAPKVAVKIT